tara:strand:+ start:53 stop:1015 length:963 start_codon:yes stop_codon:yes gene_type:complete
MSSLLEQAIIDAKELREAAIKSAEAAIVEKYSDEVKDSIEKLLEQEDEDLDIGLDDEDTDQDSEGTLEQVPMAHLSDEEEVVMVDLDDIIAAAAEEPEDADDEELEIDRMELGMETDTDPAPANRDDEIEINEEDLVNLFKEMMVVDIPEVELDRAEENLEKDELEQDEEVEGLYTDGMDSDDIKELEKTMAKNESLVKQNKNLKNILSEVKNKLQEISLQNARLLYSNRVLQNPSLNERQKVKIVEMVSQTRSVEQAKMVFETLQKTTGETSKKAPQSLSEAVTKRSSIILGGNRNEETQNEGSSPTYSRWATLAGTNK